MVESCPDERAESYFKDISRLWDLRLACLLATESLVMSAYFTFNANCSYLIEGTFHGSVMTAATIVLIFGVLCSGSTLLKQVIWDFSIDYPQGVGKIFDLSVYRVLRYIWFTYCVYTFPLLINYP